MRFFDFTVKKSASRKKILKRHFEKYPSKIVKISENELMGFQI